MDLPITSLTAAVAAVALVALSLPVTFRRMKVGASLGDGGDQTLQRRIRAQGNFIEYALAILLMALNEAGGAAPGLLWTMAGTLCVGRLLHVLGMLGGRLPPLAAGMVLTYSSLLIGAAGLVRALF